MHQYTWYGKEGTPKEIIYYIIISRQRRPLVCNYHSFHDADLGSTDHRLVAAKIHLNLKYQLA